MEAKIVNYNDNLILKVNGERLIPAAYMSYLEEGADYDGFKRLGYNLFCACVYMGDCSINEYSGVRPFGDCVWKSRDEYDFAPVYNSVKKIVGDGKQKVYVMLRVNLNTPQWWRRENPDELTVLTDGKKYMQSVFSEKWRADAKQFLTKLCEYIKDSEFSENVIAIQVAGMQTEEWIAMWTPTGTLDCSPCAKKSFERWCKKRQKNNFIAYLPTPNEVKTRNANNFVDIDKYAALTEYLEFFNEGYADVIQSFCAHIKDIASNLLVGVFYGYIGQLPCDRGHSAVAKLLCDKNIDFFASPFSYVDGRKGAKDWFYHGVMDSCALAGKIWFLEADVRTYKTQALYETNPELMSGENTINYFKAPVFMGPTTEKETLWHLLRAFSKVLISKNAFWWFDMWGGWYESPKMMEFMQTARQLYQAEMGRSTKKIAELAVILDEKASYGISDEYFFQTHYHQLVELGVTGIPYDIYHVTDVKRIKEQYKALLYLTPSTEDFKGNIFVSNDDKISKQGKFTAEEIREFLVKHNTHVWSEDNIVYANERFVCVTATKEGEVQLVMPKACKIKAFTSGEIYTGEKFVFVFEYNQTELFEVIE